MGCGCDDCSTIEAIDVEPWVKVMERIAKETYEGKIKKGDLDTAYIIKTFDELEGGLKKGYGTSFAKIDKSTGLPAQNVVALQQNIFRFSGAKNATMLAQINELLSKDGKRPSFADFKREVLKLNPNYNQNYLQAEFQTALQAGKMANQWGEYERNKKLFPNLKYKSQEDDRVREEHERLNGIIKPVDDPFWNSYYPPNGWRCRCYVVQTAEDSTEDKNMPKIEEKDVKPEFRNNIGKSGQVFKEGTENGGKPHPYFALVKDNEGYRAAFELTKINAPYNAISKQVRESIFADDNMPARMDNLQHAQMIGNNLNLKVDILPMVRLEKYKNPEFRINGIIGDGVKRTGNIKNTINNAFVNKLGKGGQLEKLEQTFLSVDLGEVKSLSGKEFKAIVNTTYNKLHFNKKVEFLIISWNKNSLIIYNKDIPNSNIEGHLFVKNKLQIILK